MVGPIIRGKMGGWRHRHRGKRLCKAEPRNWHHATAIHQEQKDGQPPTNSWQGQKGFFPGYFRENSPASTWILDFHRNWENKILLLFWTTQVVVALGHEYDIFRDVEGTVGATRGSIHSDTLRALAKLRRATASVSIASEDTHTQKTQSQGHTMWWAEQTFARHLKTEPWVCK